MYGIWSVGVYICIHTLIGIHKSLFYQTLMKTSKEPSSEGLSTGYLTTLVPETMKGMALGYRIVLQPPSEAKRDP